MKPIIALLTLIPTLAFGQHVADEAGFLTPDKLAAIEAALTNRPVYVQTLQTKPEDLRAYANARIEHFLHDGAQARASFLIVVTKEPRAWRIAQSPPGAIAESRVQEAGDKMVVQLHKGNLIQAFLDATDVLAPKVKQASIPMPSLFLIPILLFFVTIAVIVFGVFHLFWRRRNLNGRGMAENLAFNSTSGPRLTDAQQSEADRIFAGYTLSQRRDISGRYFNSPYYSPSCYNDSAAFYNLLLMEDILDSHRAYNQQTVIFERELPSSPPVAYTEAPTVAPIESYDRTEETPTAAPSPPLDFSSPSTNDSSSSNASPSSNDSSGSSGSWSSDTSSSGCGSDSSGAGGSW